MSSSETLARGSRSRSRKRVRAIWSRKLALNWASAIPSALSRLRSWAKSNWFWRAMFCSARSTAASSTRIPVSRATCNCRRSLIRPSSTSRVSAARSGWGRRCCAICCCARCNSKRNSLKVMGSVLTTATMKSACCCWLCAGWHRLIDSARLIVVRRNICMAQ